MLSGIWSKSIKRYIVLNGGRNCLWGEEHSRGGFPPELDDDFLGCGWGFDCFEGSDSDPDNTEYNVIFDAWREDSWVIREILLGLFTYILNFIWNYRNILPYEISGSRGRAKELRKVHNSQFTMLVTLYFNGYYEMSGILRYLDKDEIGSCRLFLILLELIYCVH